MELIRYVGAIALVLGLLVFAVHRFGRPGLGGFASPGGSRAALERVSWVRLTPQHTLHLVRCGQQSWLVACHPSGTAVIGTPETGGREEKAGGARA